MKSPLQLLRLLLGKFIAVEVNFLLDFWYMQNGLKRACFQTVLER